MRIPKTLGGCADRLYTLRADRQKLSKQVEKIKEEERAVKDELVNKLSKSNAQGVAGKKARASITTKDVASVKDWPKFYKYVLKTKDFSLLQRRVSDAAVQERWEDKKKVPGVMPYKVINVSITKVS